ncbi:deoxyguanosinetriphosphate triphosphohydrolase [Alteromonas sp. KUL49]|uniref:deoxyguanosinetriphosphate triphosphohydrolase n=1 Tax=Alteromonas sp. KUL49 TaxID=2480798 RepID=UPI00102EE514|nr:deoxyguanosinetriphosphate triphosphohydrolase [Alteromonas sp. KUL49]TAP36908.1 deoxyguanosinetriphosphate triphosphohydrolase [Alteromonas sp. KUL49]GEA13179.1 hypothetical protein KUL49_35540 [Alteromonas sp. KUL49]
MNTATSSISRFRALQNKVNNEVQLPLPFEGYPSEYAPKQNKGWHYLLADSVSFKKDTHHAIRIQKPNKEKMPEWISKLITGGQCKTLYVENLDLDLQPTECEMIKKLCELFSVSLVNVKVSQESGDTNLVTGPW